MTDLKRIKDVHINKYEPLLKNSARGRQAGQRSILFLIIGILVGVTFAIHFLVPRIIAAVPSTRHTSKDPTDTFIADRLFKEVRVLCMVMTTPESFEERGKHVRATWGQHCNKLLFMSSITDESQDIVGLPINDTYDNLWGKTKAAFRYVFEHHYNDADFFMKADDDTYVILENLRQLLYAYSPSFPVYFGCKFKRYVEKGFMSGGAGYVLSKEALKRFVVDGLSKKSKCKAANEGVEDMELGYCMQLQDVLGVDTRDNFGRGRFFPMSVQDHIANDTPEWYNRYLAFPLRQGFDCCSDVAISFHYVAPKEMYLYEYLVYHLKIVQQIPKKLSWEDVRKLHNLTQN